MTREEAIQVLQTSLTSPFIYGEYADAISMAIEALAEQKTGEWISEELANMICNEICYYKEVTVDADSLNDLCEGCLIKKMKYGRPTGWIPVSERLPDDDGRYLVTYPLLRRDDLWVATAWYGTPPMPNRPVKGKCFFVSDDEWGDVPYDDVMAWMPLPEPYREGGKEDD